MPDENFNSNGRTLHFSIEGSIVTDTARNSLYQNNNFVHAMDLILSATVTDQLTEADRIYQALKILNGNLRTAGTYPGPDYGIYPDTPTKPNLLKTWFQNIQTTLDKQTTELDQLHKKLQCLDDILPDYIKDQIRETLDEFGMDPLFERRPEPTVSFMGQEITPDTIQDTLDHMKSETAEQSDYGWLSPDGTFYPGEFGEHVASAMRLAKKFYPEELHVNNQREDHILYSHSWILMHNPMYGTAFPNYAPEARITKKQKDFIYKYYTDRDKPGLADKYLKQLE